MIMMKEELTKKEVKNLRSVNILGKSIPVIAAMTLTAGIASAVILASMVGYVHISPKPEPVWLSPSTYDMNVYQGDRVEVMGTVINEKGTVIPCELDTEVWAYTYTILADGTVTYTEVDPALISVTYLDYATHMPLPDADGDGMPEIAASAGNTPFIIEIAPDPTIPTDTSVRIETTLLEYTLSIT